VPQKVGRRAAADAAQFATMVFERETPVERQNVEIRQPSAIGKATDEARRTDEAINVSPAQYHRDAKKLRM